MELRTRHYLLRSCFPVSDNLLHQAAMGGATTKGKRRAFLYTPAAVQDWQAIITNALASIDAAHGGRPVLPEGIGYKVMIQVEMPEDVYGYLPSRKLKQQDAANVIKALQDCLFEAIGENDKVAAFSGAAKWVNKDIDRCNVLISLTETRLWQEPLVPFEVLADGRVWDVSETYALADKIRGKKAPKEAPPDGPQKPESRKKRSMKAPKLPSLKDLEKGLR